MEYSIGAKAGVRVIQCRAWPVSGWARSRSAKTSAPDCPEPTTVTCPAPARPARRVRYSAEWNTSGPSSPASAAGTDGSVPTPSTMLRASTVRAARMWPSAWTLTSASNSPVSARQRSASTRAPKRADARPVATQRQ